MLSSKSIVNNIITQIDFKRANIIIEYGPGYGIITKQLLKNMKPDAILFVFETNHNFIKHLMSINNSRLVIINADAKSALLILRNRYKIEDVDYIISTIPFTLFGQYLKRRIISSSYIMLKERGEFFTYQYNPLIYSIIKSKFKEHSIKASLINFPPAFIMQGLK